MVNVKRYRVLAERIWYPSPAQLRKIERGELPEGARSTDRMARHGEVISDLPARNVGLYLRKGLIELVQDETPETEGGDV